MIFLNYKERTNWCRTKWVRSLYFCFKKRNLYFISPPNLMEYHFCTKTIVVHAYSPRSFLNLKVKGSNCFRGFYFHLFFSSLYFMFLYLFFQKYIFPKLIFGTYSLPKRRGVVGKKSANGIPLYLSCLIIDIFVLIFLL